MADPGADREAEVTVRLPRAQAAALAKVADYGLRAAEAFGLIQNTATAEQALGRLNAALSAGRKGR